MKLTILGSHGPYPGPDGACSGYLVEDNGVNVLVDCGNGVISRYQKYHDLKDLKYIILTHLHSDHMADMLVLRYALDIMMKKGYINEPVNVYCPDEPSKVIEELGFNDVFKIKHIDEELKLDIENFTITFKEMVHPVKTFAVKFNNGDKTFVFSSDTIYNDQLVFFASNSDLFLCDGNLLNGEKGPHLTAKQAAKISKSAHCKKLVVTHLWPQNSIEEYEKEVSEVVNDASIAKPFEVYYV
ncbi:beta-lactamase domain protein [Thermoanaerobacterium xylanolyticum LX-11]|uniref:Beta-lactamase domain protein n=1 Tax=Thermoanaerobacterium xylanolyticum (strain ATCC 49914 / DSM 7097 / LX-11) TaxID=858215 RepID=F6BH86_THEXL|nr:MBL fold metallo-hydrolase [Thermoanaerobacterium xylanolyticum]AEF17559.1 beta-lactamase domain protein [Thermoanaerobacterium xylanolyticum LX-11]